MVYNCGGYERSETLKLLAGKVDIYLPDLKYADNALAAQLSGAKDYFETATAAIREMVRQTGPVQQEHDRVKKRDRAAFDPAGPCGKFPEGTGLAGRNLQAR